MYSARRQDSGSDFLPLEQHKVVAISCVLRSREQLKVWSLGELDSGEAELITRFFDGIEKYTPDLVSWNGGGFDLPVLHYRALKASVQAPRYWETGDEDQSFRWNNYLSRFHWRHLDLMDVLSGFQVRGRASLADMALLLGLPGKLGFSGAQVWEAVLDGQLASGVELTLFDDPLLGNSALDRLANAAHQLVIEGPSYRAKLSPKRIRPVSTLQVSMRKKLRLRHKFL